MPIDLGMHPAEKLTRIFTLLEEADKFQSFSVCQLGPLEKTGALSKLTVLDAYYSTSWILAHAKLEREKIGETIYYVLHLMFRPKDKRVRWNSTTVQVKLTRKESNLRLTRYYTESNFYGLTIELYPTPQSYIHLIFYPIEVKLLNAMEVAITEEIPIIEVGTEGEGEVELQEVTEEGGAHIYTTKESTAILIAALKAKLEDAMELKRIYEGELQSFESFGDTAKVTQWKKLVAGQEQLIRKLKELITDLQK